MGNIKEQRNIGERRNQGTGEYWGTGESRNGGMGESRNGYWGYIGDIVIDRNFYFTIMEWKAFHSTVSRAVFFLIIEY
jgi:hypothetical protein